MKKLLTFTLSLTCTLLTAIPHYYCVAADSRYYPALLNLIGSIHKNDQANLAEIAVFDLGLEPAQKQQLARMAQVTVQVVVPVHPELLRHFKTSPQNRRVRGWFAWKPVVIKQALDLFPYVLYIDAGAVVLQDLDDLFQHINRVGYFFMTCGPHTIADTITATTKAQLLPQFSPAQQQLILAPDSFKISAGLQGVSRQVYQSYVLPMYQLAHDLSYFADDGSARYGFGSGRHDQPLFSIYVYLNGFKINSEGISQLYPTAERVRQIHIHWHPDCVSEKHTSIFQCRTSPGKYGNLHKFIEYRS